MWPEAHHREVAYTTLSSFRVKRLFFAFLCIEPANQCEVNHIRRVDGGAL